MVKRMNELTMHDGDTIQAITIEEEMKRSYMDYAMSVIVSRALPDARDGLKPVHRRILYAMKDGGYGSGQPFRKSARIVGDVMGKYHPHGDSAIYDSMVRMAQPFSLRLPLVSGQGNFGSMDGDPPAAMRYTEARLNKPAETMLEDIDKQTVDFQANYDESLHEPKVLPARFPNLLVNGAGGIAVGMATNIPPHNLGEVINATLAYIDNPDLSLEELLDIIPGPDFPTGGIILGRNGIRQAFETGRGSIIMRARVEIERPDHAKEALIVREIPYQVNKSKLVERIAEVVRAKIVEGISDLRDESDRDGVRVVIEIKRDAMAEIVLNQLYRYTPLQTSFGVQMLALDNGKPDMMPVGRAIQAFIKFREEIITKRSAFLLFKARERAHVLAGLLVAIGNLDPVIELIRKSTDPVQARQDLMSQIWPAATAENFIKLIDDPAHQVIDGGYKLSESQARSILELRLQRLTGMERNKLEEETNALAKDIEDYLNILGSHERRMDVMRSELIEIKDNFANARRTTIEDSEFEHDIEDLIQREDMVVTVTHSGYIKRVPLSTYRAQRRGGKGRSGMTTKEDDVLVNVFVTSTHTPLLFLSSKGLAYRIKTYRLPVGGPTTRGKAMVNILPLGTDETITAILSLPEDDTSWSDHHILFATASGKVRRNKLSDFALIRSSGKIAMKLEENDTLIGAKLCDANHDVFLASRNNRAIRFAVSNQDSQGNESGVRVFSGRTSTGVRGIRLDKDDQIIQLALLSSTPHSSEIRREYLQAKAALRRLKYDQQSGQVESEGLERDRIRVANLEDATFNAMQENEEFVLSVSSDGMGQLTSAYDFRSTGRGGKGITNMDISKRKNAYIVASFPVTPETDQLILITDSGQIIRIALSEVRQVSRSSKGVILFDLAKGERIVSCARLQTGEDDDSDLENDSIKDEDESLIDIDAEGSNTESLSVQQSPDNDDTV